MIECWGPYACFTRPELSVDRVSYPVMTPSVARGILDGIYWHPGMHWIVDGIYVCNPIRYINLTTSECDSKGLGAKKLQNALVKGQPLSFNEGRTMRHSMMLKDVRYVISAHFVMTDKATGSDNPDKFTDIILNRLDNGKQFRDVYFGIRELTANFRKWDSDFVPSIARENMGKHDMGIMLFDMDYSNVDDVGNRIDDEQKLISPMFYHAMMEDGFIRVPAPWSMEVLR